MGECNHDCSSCGEKCENREIPKENPHKLSNIHKVIAVVSGKGGVGKSFVTSLLANGMTNRGYKTAIIDADITGPSIPKMYGIHGNIEGDEQGIYPKEAVNTIKIMSSNLLLENENAPVIWRGPVIAGMVKQFWTEVIYGDIDYMFIDCPPGTGDVPLTVFQSIKVDGIVVVTSPQDLVTMVVEKAVKMANMMNIPIVGVVENLSYIICEDCGKKINVFGESNISKVAEDFNLKLLAKLPIDSKIAKLADEGKFADVDPSNVLAVLDEIERY